MVVENLTFEVSANASNAAKSIDALSLSFQKLKTATSVNSIAKINTAIQSLNEALRQINTTSLEAVSKALGSLGSNINTSAIDGFTKSLQNADVELRQKPKDCNVASTSITRLSKSATKSTSAIGKFTKAIGRIALYRGIRTIIKGITSAMEEGLENAYEYSKTINGSLYNSMNQIATAANQCKNQWGAALGELIELLKPFIIWVLNALTTIAEKVTQFLAAIQGKSTYLKAQSVATKWKDDTESAAKAAKEYKNTLLGFDEINRLDDQGSSSSGTGSNSGNNYALNYTESPLEDWAMDLSDLSNKVGLYFDKFKNKLKEVADAVVEAAYEMGLVTEEQLERIKEKLRNLFPEPNTEPMKSGAIEAFGAVQADAVATTDFINGLSPTFDWTLMKRNSVETTEAVKKDWQFAYAYLLGLGLSGVVSVKSFLGEIYDAVAEKIGEMETATSEALAWTTVQISLAVVNAVKAFESMKDGLSEKLGECKTAVNVFCTVMKNSFLVAVLYAKNQFNSLANTVSSVISAATSKLQGLMTYANNVAQAIANAISLSSKLSSSTSTTYTANGKQNVDLTNNSYLNSAVNLPATIWSLGKSTTSTSGISSLFSTLKAAMGYANGGIVGSGELFLANENGTHEYIGKIGNNTGVANNDMIIEGIKQGVYEAVTSANGNKNSNHQVTLNINGKAFCRAIYSDMKSVTNEHGISLVNA